MTSQNLQSQRPKPPFPEQQQQAPGLESQMNPKPDYGENSYHGSGKLQGKAAIITGGDSGIGRAVAGDIQQEAHCQQIVKRVQSEFGKLDILVNNAAFQMSRESIEEISSEEFDRTFKTNIYAMFYLCKAAVPYMEPGSAIINTCSINAAEPKPKLLAYSATKAAIVNFTGGLAQSLAEKGIRVNSVAPGPVWTPLIPATMPNEQVTQFGQQVPMQRPAQPAELAPVYVLLASQDGSYISGAVIP
ncbi:MAG: SDR family oxidoreductase [Nostoc sp.]